MQEYYSSECYYFDLILKYFFKKNAGSTDLNQKITISNKMYHWFLSPFNPKLINAVNINIIIHTQDIPFSWLLKLKSSVKYFCNITEK